MVKRLLSALPSGNSSLIFSPRASVCSFEKIMENEEIPISRFIDTITIAGEAKPGILKELAKKHISEDTLYMNVEKIKSLVKSIKYGATE